MERPGSIQDMSSCGVLGSPRSPRACLACGRVRLPPTVPLTSAYMSDAGAYLLDSGRIFVLWLGKRVPKEFISQARRMDECGHLADELKKGNCVISCPV